MPYKVRIIHISVVHEEGGGGGDETVCVMSKRINAQNKTVMFHLVSLHYMHAGVMV